MATFEWVCITLLGWLVLGLATIKIAAWFGHVWGFHFTNPVLCRAAIVFQAPALLLECKVMDWAHPGEDELAVGAARLLWAKFKEPRADLQSLLDRISERPAD